MVTIWRQLGALLGLANLGALLIACKLGGDTVTLQASAGKCSLSVSIKDHEGKVTEKTVRRNWKEKVHAPKGSKLSLSVIAINCVRRPTCSLSKGGKTFGNAKSHSRGQVTCAGTVP